MVVVVVVNLFDPFLGMGVRSPKIGRLPTDGTRGPEVRGYGRIWPYADGPVQGSQTRDMKDPVIQPQLLHEGVSVRLTLWR